MPGSPQKSKSIDIRRLTQIVDKGMNAPQVAFEFSNHDIYKKQNKPGASFENRYVRRNK